MALKEEILDMKKEVELLKQENKNKKQVNNFDLGNTFKKIIYFLLFLILILISVIIFFAIKNNDLAKKLSEETCESDIMEQDGLYNFIDSKGNMITTDSETLNEFIESYYNGKAKKNN